MSSSPATQGLNGWWRRWTTLPAKLEILDVNEGTLGNWMNMAKKRGEVTDKPLSVEDRVRPTELEDSR